MKRFIIIALLIAFGVSAIAQTSGYDYKKNRRTGLWDMVVKVDSTISFDNTNRITKIGYTAGINATGVNSTYIGYESGKLATIPTGTTLIGTRCGDLGILTGKDNTSVGAYSFRDAVAARNNAIYGYFSGQNITNGNDNCAFGHSSLLSDTAGDYNVAVGSGALYSQQRANGTVAVGYQAGYLMNPDTVGSAVTLVGYRAAANNVDIRYSTIIGAAAGENQDSGKYNTALGYATLRENNGVGNVALGHEVMYQDTAGNYNVFSGTYNNRLSKGSYGCVNIGNNGSRFDTVGGNYSIGLGFSNNQYNQSNDYNITIGSFASAGTSNFTNNRNIAIGYKSQYLGGSGTKNITIGNHTLEDITTAHDNIAIGDSALMNGTTAYSNISIGNNSSTEMTGAGALQNTVVGVNANRYGVANRGNSYFGYEAGRGVTLNTHTYNTGVGFSNQKGITTGTYNTSMGYNILPSITTGSYNVCIGGGSITTGAYNTFIGYQAGGSGNHPADSFNIFIGANCGLLETGSNRLHIDNNGGLTPLIYGEFDNDIVKINGDLTVTGNTTIDGYVLPQKAIHAYCYFPETSVTLTISASSTWYHLTNATNDLFANCELDGFTVSGDTITVSDYAGDYDFTGSVNFTGSANQTYKFRFWNVTQGTGIPIGKAAEGANVDICGVTVSSYGEGINKGDEIILQVSNLDATGNLDLKSGSIKISLVHL